MSANSDYGTVGDEKPTFKPRPVPGILADMDEETHSKLLNYLTTRLKQGNRDRSQRLTRYSRIDRLISTWQKLSADDSTREKEEDNTGRQQAIGMNLPLLVSHLEDMVAFYAEVFAPQRRDFYALPSKAESASTKELAGKMNKDTRSRNYYGEVCMALRSLIKYNVGGLSVRWEVGGGQGELSQPGNRFEAIDMYNYLWDPTIVDVSKIHNDAEWAAKISAKNRMWLQKRQLKGVLQRVDKVFEDCDKSNSGKRSAVFYKSPPNHVGLSTDGGDARTQANTQAVNWESYGAGLEADGESEIIGFEIAEMYCWLNPMQFGLVDDTRSGADQVSGEEDNGDLNSGLDSEGAGYGLWRFIIVNGAQVCGAWPVTTVTGADPEIPHYLTHMIQDDMRQAQRSNMELMKPFQRFASFLMNIFIAGARKNIWGIKGIDPSMFDSSQLEKGDVAVTLMSKTPGRDVRTGIATLDSNTGVQESMQMLGSTLEVMRSMFPSQALPSQIAGMDRAVKNQVSAVLQGVHRRLHMIARLLDASMMGPMRLEAYRNLAVYDGESLSGLDEEKVAQVLGSGLQSLNAESLADQLREVLFAIIQNKDAMASFDLPGLFSHWSQLMNMPTDLGDFAKQAPIPPAGPPVDPNAAPGAQAPVAFPGA